MSQNIEIEFKNIVTFDEFNKLKTFFQIVDSDFIIQENHYFDTPAFDLKKSGSALRIRNKNGKLEMTLKQPHPDGLLETNETLNQLEADQLLQNGEINQGPIRKLIEKMNINPELIQYFGSLRTNRAEKEYNGGLIVLDHSYYLNKEDFEIEYEVSNRKIGKKHFSELLEQLQIPIRVTENKIKRFYIEKYKQQC